MYLLAWLRVQLLTYYGGDLDSRLAHLLAPTQSKALTKTRFDLLKQVLPALAPNPPAEVPEPISSSLHYNLQLPPPPSKKICEYLRGTNLPKMHRPIAFMSHTSPRPGATFIMNVSQNPKTPAITFRY